MADAKKAAKAAPVKATASPPAAGEAGSGATGAPGSAQPEQLQHPSAVGEPEIEIAKRSQDVDEYRSGEHRKVFVVQKNPLGDDYDDAMHAANIDAMRQAMISQGLRPVEDGHFVGAEEHPDGQSVCLTYACACIPAAVATPEQSVVRVTVDDQHALEREQAQTEKRTSRGGE